jgi:hypothetical protein
MNIAAGVEKRLGDLGALVRVFHVEDEKGGSLAAFEAEICCLRLELLEKAEIAFCRAPDFSASLPSVASM